MALKQQFSQLLSLSRCTDWPKEHAMKVTAFHFTIFILTGSFFIQFNFIANMTDIIGEIEETNLRCNAIFLYIVMLSG